jgi:hypothetical protein
MYASEFTYLGERSLRDRSSFMVGGGGVASKRNIFLGKNFGDPIIKKSFSLTSNNNYIQ